MCCLLALLDPLLRCTPFVVEPHDHPARQVQIRDNKADLREQLPGMVLDFRHHPTRRLPSGRLVEKAFVPDYWLAHGP